MSMYVSPARSATALRNFHITSIGNIQQADCKTISHARNTIASAAWCMDMHQLLDVAIAYGFEGTMRNSIVSHLTESILATSNDPVIRTLIDDTPVMDYSVADEPIDEPVGDYECAFATQPKPVMILDVLKEHKVSNVSEAPISEKKVRFSEQSVDELPTLVRTMSKIDAFQTPTKPVTPVTKKTDQIAPQKKLDWADVTDEESKFNTAIAEAAKQKREHLPWALRVKLADVPDKELDAVIEAKQASELVTKKMTNIKKFYSMTPAKPVKKISNNDVKAMLAEKKIAQDEADAGFIKVGGKRRFVAPSKPQIVTSNNKYPEKQKSTTSAKWFFFPDKPIMSETDDWNLWDYNTDHSGLAVPIGWYRLAINKFKINRKSSFVHTRHEDGSWSHEEEIHLNNDPSGKQIKYVSVSVDYLRWILTPPPMRRGVCPDE